MKYLLTLYILLVNSVSLLSQTVIKGNVEEAISGESIVGANIMVKNQKGSLVYYTR